MFRNKNFLLIYCRCIVALSLGFSFYAKADYPWETKEHLKSKNFLELNVSSSYFVKQLKQASFAYAQWSYHNPTVDVDVAYRYSHSEGKHYASLNELAVTFPFFYPYMTFTIGSRDQGWSESDKYWNFGLWQPRHIIDPFRPSQMGLPGLYIDWSGPVSVTAFFSYLSLPDIVIYPDLVDGGVQSKNPFFISSILSSDSGSIQWELEGFQSFNWISFLKPAVAFQLKHRLPHSDLSLAYAYKTANQLQYSILLETINLSDLSDKNRNIIVKDLKYAVGYHHLTTLEFKVKPMDGMTFFASLFYENPDKNSYTPGWTYDDFESHLTTSMHLRFQKKAGENQTVFTIGYAKVFESKLREDKSNLITEDIELFFGRGFDWIEAASASLEYHTERILSGYDFKFRLNYALDNKFYLVNFENNFYITPRFLTYLSGDILFRLDRSFETAINSSAIRRYKDLSRVIFGVKYVF